MGLLRALRVFETPASLLGLNCIFAIGPKHSANVVYCVCGLGLKIAVSILCLRTVVIEMVEATPRHLNIINMLLLADYKFFSILLFLSVIYFHVRKDEDYRKIFATLSEVAGENYCYDELFSCLRRNSKIAGALAFGTIFCMFLLQVTQDGLGDKLDVAHSAVTAFTCMYFEIKFSVVAKATLFVLKRVNAGVQVAAWAPNRSAELFPQLRASHEKLYQLVEDSSQTFQCVLIFAAILQFQVALYSSYVACINVWELEASFMQFKIKLMLITSIWVLAIVVNYVHLTSTCSATLAEVNSTMLCSRVLDDICCKKIFHGYKGADFLMLISLLLGNIFSLFFY